MELYRNKWLVKGLHSFADFEIIAEELFKRYLSINMTIIQEDFIREVMSWIERSVKALPLFLGKNTFLKF